MQQPQPPPPQRFGVGPSRFPPPSPGPGYSGTPRAAVYAGGGPVISGSIGSMMGGARMGMGPPTGAVTPHGPVGVAGPPGATMTPHAYPAPPPTPRTSAGGKGKEKEKGGAGSKTAPSDKEKEEEGGVHVGAAAMPSPLHSGLDRKRSAPPATDPRQLTSQATKTKKKKKVADKILPQRVRDLVPESEAYMDLLSFERKLDSTIMRKRLDIQEALKRPMKQKKKLRIFISNTFYPAKHDQTDDAPAAPPGGGAGPDETVASWELRVEGRLMDDGGAAKGGVGGAPGGAKPAGGESVDPSKAKRKFSSFFKSLVIELDKELYGPDNHLVEWHRTATTQETDGFQVKRPGDQNVKCTLLLMLDYQPMQFKLDLRLARLLGIHTQTRPVIINALWQYIKTHRLQDSHEREYINCDKYLEQILDCSRMKFSEIPSRLHPLLMPPDPIVINHVIMVDGPDAKKTACYDIDVEVDDTLKQQMNSFLLSSQSQQEIQALDSKIHETVETINQLKTNRDFFLGFAKTPQEFINSWLVSQTRDLKTMTDVAGSAEEERRADFYFQPWTQEAVSRYFFGKVQQRRMELEQMLGVRNQ